MLSQVAHHGQSGWLHSLHKERAVGSFHLNDMKVFVSRTENERPDAAGWQTMAQAAEEEQERIDERVQNNEENELQIHKEDREPEEEWWDELVNYPDAQTDKQNRQYWNGREVNLSRAQR